MIRKLRRSPYECNEKPIKVILSDPMPEIPVPLRSPVKEPPRNPPLEIPPENPPEEIPPRKDPPKKKLPVEDPPPTGI